MTSISLLLACKHTHTHTCTHSLVSHRRNGMGDRGVKAVVDALEGNTVLRRLDLRVNSIGLVSGGREV